MKVVLKYTMKVIDFNRKAEEEMLCRLTDQNPGLWIEIQNTDIVAHSGQIWRQQ